MFTRWGLGVAAARDNSYSRLKFTQLEWKRREPSSYWHATYSRVESSLNPHSSWTNTITTDLPSFSHDLSMVGLGFINSKLWVLDRWPALLKGGVFSREEAAKELPLSANRPNIHEDLDKMQIWFRTAERKFCRLESCIMGEAKNKKLWPCVDALRQLCTSTMKCGHQILKWNRGIQTLLF